MSVSFGLRLIEILTFFFYYTVVINKNLAQEDKKMDFVTYDYKTIRTKKENKYRVLDIVGAFGYEVIETKELPTNVIISVKRDSSISIKKELDEKMDEALTLVEGISNAEGKKKNKSLIISLTIGIIGILTFGGGMSAYMTGDGSFKFVTLGIVLGIIGIIIMIINEPIYKKLLENSISKYTPIIDEYNQRINKVLEEANEMIKKSLE